MNILVKFPTRSRPDRFFKTLDAYYGLASNIDKMHFLISCDVDDETMNNHEIIEKFKNYKNLTVKFSENKTKIEAINSNIHDLEYDYDIILLASDDMIPVIEKYDDIIRYYMGYYYKDLDGVLWFNDGIQGSNLNTLSILGAKYYKRFNYIYHPDYKSFFCDNEFTEVSIKLNRCVYIDMIIIKHDHFCIDETLLDDLYLINHDYVEHDRSIWIKRKIKNYE